MSNKDSAAEQRCVNCGRERGVADAPLMRCEADNAEYCSFSEAASEPTMLHYFVPHHASDYCLICSRGVLDHPETPKHNLPAAGEGVPELHIVSGGESLSIFDIMQRFRLDGSCEQIIKEALTRMAQQTTPVLHVQQNKNLSGVGKPPLPNVEGVLAAEADGQASLLPCPFCGVVPRIADWPEREDEYAYEISCLEEGCLVGPHIFAITSKKAITAWNTRASDASGYVRGLEAAAKLADAYADANKAHAILPMEIAANIRALISQHSPEVKIK